VVVVQMGPKLEAGPCLKDVDWKKICPLPFGYPNLFPLNVPWQQVSKRL
jgi:hypothetical protein